MSYVAAIIGGVTGVGAAVAPLFGNQKSGSRGTTAGPLNPAVRQLNYLFGQPTVTSFSSRGAPRTWYEGYAEGDVFGTTLKDTIEKYLQDPRSMVPGTNVPLWQSLIGTGEDFANSQERFRSGMQGAVGTAAELTQTGIPTDGSSYFNEAIRRLGTEVTPMLAEQSGFGTQGSGFLHGGYNAAQDLLGQASLANIDLQEAATNRRMSAAPLLSTLLAAEQSVPLNIGTMLSSISNSERLAPVSLFQSLMSSGSNQGPYQVPGYNPQDTGANYSAAMTGLSGILNALGNWNQASSSGVAPTSTSLGANRTGSILLDYGGNDMFNSLSGG